MYKFILHTFLYFPTSLRGGGTNDSNVKTEFSAQTVTMTFLKLFIKVFTSILLIFTMQVNEAYQLTNDDATAGAIYSIYGQWKEHGDADFTGLMQTMNNHYCLYMDEAIYCALFEAPTTKAVLKTDALTQVNDWYCKKMLECSDHMDPSTEATATFALAKKIPLSYWGQNDDHIVLDSLEDFGHLLDYLVDDNNGYNEMKNFVKWHNVNKKFVVLYKET